MRSFHYRWEYALQSPPETLWEFVADTNRFNKDTDLPPVTQLLGEDERITNARRELLFHRFGLPVQWEEDPFEWVRPHHFTVVRHYSRGPVDQMQVHCELAEREDGGTTLSYEVWASPRNLLGYVAIPMQIGLIRARKFRQVFHEYDQIIQQDNRLITQERRQVSQGGHRRISEIQHHLIETTDYSEDLIAKLVHLIESGDDLTVAQLKPYLLAEHWQAPRRTVLELCLDATRAGLLDFQWRQLCPTCRVDREHAHSLETLTEEVHCDICNIDFEANLATSVELTFHPNPSIRTLEDAQDFCVAGPQVTPHVIVQQLVVPGETLQVSPDLEPGRYRLRGLDLQGNVAVRAIGNGAEHAEIAVPAQQWTATTELRLNLSPDITITNETKHERLILLERIAWADNEVMGADVIALQRFRDLFSSEILRPGQEISVGSNAIVFTDIRGSTSMYRQEGDARAFGIVMDHFELLRESIAGFGGAVVKTIGDAIMAVFQNPKDAVQTMAIAQRRLREQEPRLTLRAGIHYGHSIAVTQNHRLDYFGSTVNIAARLEGISSGDDVVISDDVYTDPEVQDYLEHTDEIVGIHSTRTTDIKGFEGEEFQIWNLGTTHANAD